MALKLDDPDGATPLDPDEIKELIPRHLTTQRELNEWEAGNIAGAQRWLLARRHKNVLTEKFCCELHRRMFDETWTWAGRFRQTDKNIGVDWGAIRVRLRDLTDDAKFWIENKTYALDEAAARFHHRLVSIHAFANGNGRHARLMADAVLRANGAGPFSWGQTNLIDAGQTRQRYLSALKAADRGIIAPLLEFVRS